MRETRPTPSTTAKGVIGELADLVHAGPGHDIGLQAPVPRGRIRIIVVDDEPSIREALVELLELEPDVELVGEARDAYQAVELAEAQRPDVALVDVRMPGGGVHAVSGIAGCSPGTRVIALSAYGDRATVVQMLRAGAAGYLVKGTSGDEVLRAIRSCVAGNGALSAEAAGEVVREMCDLLERSEQAAQELRALDQTKSELIQILSHELLTPVTTIQGAVITVLNRHDALDAATVERLLASCSRAVDRIRKLATRLATVARLNERRIGVRTSATTLGHVVARALAGLPGSADRVALTSSPSAGLTCDVDLASAAVGAVIENALAFTSGDQRVEIALDTCLEGSQLRVSDRGPGIPVGDRERIFESFHQGDSSETRAHAGVGMGLYLAHRIMDAHAGAIRVDPRPGGGSTFTLSFPSGEPGRR